MAAPTRSCLACHRRNEKAALLRLAIEAGKVTVDASARLPGRGAYLCRRSECLEAALRRGGAPILGALRLPRRPHPVGSPMSPLSQMSLDGPQLRAAWSQAVRHGGELPPAGVSE